MKIAFLSESPEMLLKVYEAETVSALSQTDKIYRKSDVIANREKFQDAVFLFSIWGMPSFSEEEIKAFFPSLKGVFYAAGLRTIFR